jgi:hypothetical protein
VGGGGGGGGGGRRCGGDGAGGQLASSGALVLVGWGGEDGCSQGLCHCGGGHSVGHAGSGVFCRVGIL